MQARKNALQLSFFSALEDPLSEEYWEELDEILKLLEWAPVIKEAGEKNTPALVK